MARKRCQLESLLAVQLSFKTAKLALHRLRYLLEYRRLDIQKLLKLGGLAVFDLFIILCAAVYTPMIDVYCEIYKGDSKV